MPVALSVGRLMCEGQAAATTTDEGDHAVSWMFENYCVWVLTTRHGDSLSDWERWRTLLPDLYAIVAMSSQPAAIRSFQSLVDSKGWLPFGRMTWSKRDNEKWCTRYRSDPEVASKLQFFSTEVWSPSWSVVERERRPVDVYLCLSRDHPASDLQGLVVAVRHDLAEANRQALRQRLSSLGGLITASQVVEFERPWARPALGGRAAADCLMDMSVSKLIEEADE